VSCGAEFHIVTFLLFCRYRGFAATNALARETREKPVSQSGVDHRESV
jgi:hypothetical protein